MKRIINTIKAGVNHPPNHERSKRSRIEIPLTAETACSCIDWSCTQTARSTSERMSVITVEESTAMPKRVRTSPISRMTGKTMPIECEAKSEAYTQALMGCSRSNNQ